MKALTLSINGSTQSVDFAEPEVEQLLKYSTRTQLESLLTAKLSTAQRQQALIKSFVDAISLVLSKTEVAHSKLVGCFELMYEHAVQSMAMANLSEELLTRQYISKTGLVMSPLNCRSTIKDAYRIAGFVRGMDKAISSLLKRKEKINILYPACGPFAPLLLPLLTLYQQQEKIDEGRIKVILLDVHPGAVTTLNQLIDDLQLSFCEIVVEESDAATYQPNFAIDLFVLEAMQHGFTKEGQFSIAKHLVKFLALDGLMIPTSISIKAMIVNGDLEFNQQWKNMEFCHSKSLQNVALEDRLELGELMLINKSTLLKMEEIELEDNTRVVTANKIRLPSGVKDMSNRLFSVYAQINTFCDEFLNEYDSGITHPRPDMSFYIDAQPKVLDHQHFVVSSGDTVQFYYQLSGLPGFVPVKVAG